MHVEGVVLVSVVYMVVLERTRTLQACHKRPLCRVWEVCRRVRSPLLLAEQLRRKPELQVCFKRCPGAKLDSMCDVDVLVCVWSSARYFIGLLVSATVQVGIQLGAGIAILVHYLFVDSSEEFKNKGVDVCGGCCAPGLWLIGAGTTVADMHGCDEFVGVHCETPTVNVPGFVIGGGIVTLALGILWGLLVHLLGFHLNLSA